MRVDGNITMPAPVQANAEVISLNIDFKSGTITQTERLANGEHVAIVLGKAVVANPPTPSAVQFKNVKITSTAAGQDFTVGQLLQKAMLQVHNTRFGITGTVAGNGVDDDIT
jgi:hypothetical protein